MGQSLADPLGARVRVRVNDAACKPISIAAGQITSPIQDAIAQQLPHSSDFSLGSAGISVTTNNNIISINIPAIFGGRSVSNRQRGIWIEMRGGTPHKR